MGDITTFMIQDHKLCDDLFVEFENNITAENWIESANIFKQFSDKLALHLQMEETVLFPEFEAATGMTQGPTAVMRAEHTQVRGLISEIEYAIENQDSEQCQGVAETLMIEYHRNHNVDIRIARIFNTYGPNMDKDDGRVVSNFIVQALKNDPITIYGDGSHSRSFCYVDDLIEGFFALMSSDDDFIGPVNLGNPDEFTILELAEQVIELTNSRSQLQFKTLPSDDPRQRQPDITLAREKLGWQPVTPLAEGLKRTIPYFESLLSQQEV